MRSPARFVLVALLALAAACARRPPRASSVEHHPRGDEASLPLDASRDGAMDAPSDAAEPRRALPDDADPGPAPGPPCGEDAQCVLVTGGCAGPMAAHRDEAAAVDARNQRRLSVASCDGRMARPVRAVCRAQRCAIEPLDFVEWRACESSRDCAPVHRHCHEWQSINRRFEREAREAMQLSQPCGPIVVPPPPRIECRYQWCATNWGGR